ncbi:MAG: sulfotransferase family protein [Bacteroidetes bacterium]|nr:sulfotransferase family protein [Bacteroidota bacterium]
MRMLKIHLISGPRNISTALMYSFAQRQDTVVVDEPFYGYYLAYTGIDHPGRAEILQRMPTDPAAIIQEVIFKDYPADVVFFKNMAKHLVGTQPDGAAPFFEKLANVFLIREPASLIASFARVVPEVTEAEIGLKHAATLFRQLNEWGTQPLVLNSDILLANPPLILEKLCGALGIAFDEQMLRWKAGPRPEDGVWAKYWYANVHKSTGFQQRTTRPDAFPEQYQSLLDEVQPYFQYLNQFAIKPDNYAATIQS